MSWQVRLTTAAEEEYWKIIQWTTERFGPRQADRYERAIIRTLEILSEDPLGILTESRPDIHPDARTIHIARSRPRARHLILYRVVDSAHVEVVGLYHDRQDIHRHLPDAFTDSAEPD